MEELGVVEDYVCVVNQLSWHIRPSDAGNGQNMSLLRKMNGLSGELNFYV